MVDESDNDALMNSDACRICVSVTYLSTTTATTITTTTTTTTTTTKLIL